VIVPPESGVFIHSQESHSARVPEGKTAHFVSIESSEIVGRTNIMQYMRNMDRIIPRWWQDRSVLNLASWSFVKIQSNPSFTHYGHCTEYHSKEH